ncbi:MAG: PHP-associated domain-containing protein [Chthoniobacterales bacterium]
MATSQTESVSGEWVKLDLHIHTLDDPKDTLDYSAHELLERAAALGFRVLAITLHDAVFDRPETFEQASLLGILLIPATEIRLDGADVICLNVSREETLELHNFDDLRRLRARRGNSIFTIAPHPFYVLGGSIGPRLIEEIDCFDAIEHCHFHRGLLNPNRRAARVAARFGKPLIATSDAHRLEAFGSHYTMIHAPAELTVENVFAALRAGPRRLTSPPSTLRDLIMTFYFVFVAHPFRQWQRGCGHDQHRAARVSQLTHSGDGKFETCPRSSRMQATAIPAQVELEPGPRI